MGTVHLKVSGIVTIVTTATFGINRLKICSSATDKELKSQGRGSYDFRMSIQGSVVKWYDNK